MYVCISVFGKFPLSVLNIYRNFYVWRASIHLISRHSFLHSMYHTYVWVCVNACGISFLVPLDLLAYRSISMHGANVIFTFVSLHSIPIHFFLSFCTVASFLCSRSPDFRLHWRGRLWAHLQLIIYCCKQKSAIKRQMPKNTSARETEKKANYTYIYDRGIHAIRACRTKREKL